jgi:hypothetical protein
MIELPAILYQSPGPHKKPGGGTYRIVGINTQEELDAKLSAGWFASSAEAITAAGDKATTPKRVAEWRIKAKAKKTKKRKPSKPLGWKQPAIEPAPVIEDAPPTRAELETKAKELGIRFDGRTRDKKLGQLIHDRLTDPTTGE